MDTTRGTLGDLQDAFSSKLQEEEIQEHELDSKLETVRKSIAQLENAGKGRSKQAQRLLEDLAELNELVSLRHKIRSLQQQQLIAPPQRLSELRDQLDELLRDEEINEEEIDDLTAEKQKKWSELKNKDGKKGKRLAEDLAVLHRMANIRKQICCSDTGAELRALQDQLQSLLDAEDIEETGVEEILEQKKYELEKVNNRDSKKGKRLIEDLAMLGEILQLQKKIKLLSANPDGAAEVKTNSPHSPPMVQPLASSLDKSLTGSSEAKSTSSYPPLMASQNSPSHPEACAPAATPPPPQTLPADPTAVDTIATIPGGPTCSVQSEAGSSQLVGELEGLQPTPLQRSGSLRAMEMAHVHCRDELNNIEETMPDCAEKNLLLLKLHLDYLLEQADRGLSGSEPMLSAEQVAVEHGHLRDRLDIESIAANHELPALEEFQSAHNKEELTVLVSRVHRFLTDIQPLDVRLTIELTSQSETAADALRGQDVILLLGNTGSGKSTTIHFLAGSTMVEHDIDGIPHIGPDEASLANCHEALRAVTSSPEAKSETRSVTAVPVQFANGTAVVLCDTPGFQDTGGPAMDIANGIGITRAVRCARSVKPVVLLSEKSMGDRFELLTPLANTLMEFIPEIQEHLGSISYIFTKYHPRMVRGIHSTLRNKAKYLTPDEKSNMGFLTLLNDMISKTKEGAYMLDPMFDRPESVLNALENAVPIQNADVFQTFASNSAMNVLKTQTMKHRLAISNAMNRFDIGLIEYKMNQLQTLASLFETANLRKPYLDCVKELATFIVQHSKNHLDQLHTVLQTSNYLEFKPKLQRCVASLFDLQGLEPLRQRHLSDRNDVTNLEDHFATVFTDEQQTLLDRVEECCANISTWYSPTTLQLLEKMEQFASVIMSIASPLSQQFFVHLSQLYLRAKFYFSNAFANAGQNATKAADTRQFQDYLAQIQTMIQAITDGELHLNNLEQKKEMLEHTKQYPYLMYDPLVSQALVELKRLDTVNAEATIALIGELSFVCELPAIEVTEVQDKLSHMYSALTTACTALLQTAVPEIERLLGENKPVNNFPVISRIMTDMRGLLSCGKVAVETSMLYHEATQRVQDFVKDLSSRVANALSFQGTNDVQFLANHLHMLKASVDCFDEEVVGSVYTNIESTFSDAQLLAQKVLHEIDVVDMQNPAEVKNLASKFLKVLAFGDLDCNIPVFADIMKTKHAASKAFDRKICEGLIQQTGTLPKAHHLPAKECWYNSIALAHACADLHFGDIPGHRSVLLKTATTSLDKYLHTCQLDIADAFGHIQSSVVANRIFPIPARLLVDPDSKQAEDYQRSSNNSIASLEADFMVRITLRDDGLLIFGSDQNVNNCLTYTAEVHGVPIPDTTTDKNDQPPLPSPKKFQPTMSSLPVVDLNPVPTIVQQKENDVGHRVSPQLQLSSQTFAPATVVTEHKQSENSVYPDLNAEPQNVYSKLDNEQNYQEPRGAKPRPAEEAPHEKIQRVFTITLDCIGHTDSSPAKYQVGAFGPDGQILETKLFRFSEMRAIHEKLKKSVRNSATFPRCFPHRFPEKPPPVRCALFKQYFKLLATLGDAVVPSKTLIRSFGFDETKAARSIRSSQNEHRQKKNAPTAPSPVDKVKTQQVQLELTIAVKGMPSILPGCVVSVFAQTQSADDQWQQPFEYVGKTEWVTRGQTENVFKQRFRCTHRLEEKLDPRRMLQLAVHMNAHKQGPNTLVGCSTVSFEELLDPSQNGVTYFPVICDYPDMRKICALSNCQTGLSVRVLSEKELAQRSRTNSFWSGLGTLFGRRSSTKEEYLHSALPKPVPTATAPPATKDPATFDDAVFVDHSSSVTHTYQEQEDVIGGQQCRALYDDGNFYDAVVVSRGERQGYVKVKFLDSGTTATVQSQDVKLLSSDDDGKEDEKKATAEDDIDETEVGPAPFGLSANGVSEKLLPLPPDVIAEFRRQCETFTDEKGVAHPGEDQCDGQLDENAAEQKDDSAMGFTARLLHKRLQELLGLGYDLPGEKSSIVQHYFYEKPDKIVEEICGEEGKLTKLAQDLTQSVSTKAQNLDSLQCRYSVVQELLVLDSLTKYDFKFESLSEKVRHRLEELNLGFENSIRVALTSLDPNELKKCSEEAQQLGQETIKSFVQQLSSKLDAELNQLNETIQKDSVESFVSPKLFSVLKSLQNLIILVPLLPKTVRQDTLALANCGRKDIRSKMVQMLELAQAEMKQHKFAKAEQIVSVMTKACSIVNDSKALEMEVNKLKTTIDQEINGSEGIGRGLLRRYIQPCELVLKNEPPEDSFKNVREGVKDGAFVVCSYTIVPEPQNYPVVAASVRTGSLAVEERKVERKLEAKTSKPEHKSSFWSSPYKNLSFFGRDKEKKTTEHKLAVTYATPSMTNTIPPPLQMQRERSQPTPKPETVKTLFYVKNSASLCVPINVSDAQLAKLEKLCRQQSSSSEVSAILSPEQLKEVEETAMHPHVPLSFEVFQSNVIIDLKKQLEQAEEFNPEYRIHWETLRKDVETAVVNFGKLAPREEPKIAHQYLEILKSFLLPADWKGILEKEQTRLETMITQAENGQRRELEEIKANQDLRQQIDSLQVFYRTRRRERFLALKHDIDLGITKRIAHLDKDLEAGLLRQVLKKAPDTWDDMESYEVLLNESMWFWHGGYYHKASNTVVYKSLAKLLQKIATRIETEANSLRNSLLRSTEHVIQGVLLMLDQFCRIPMKKKFSQYLKGTYPKVQLNVMESLIDFGKQMTSLQNEMFSALKSQDITTLASRLDRIKKLDDSFKTATELASFTKAMSPQFQQSLKSCSTYQQLQMKLKKEILRWKDEIIAPLVGEKHLMTANASDRDVYYKALSAKIEPLRGATVLGSHVDATWMDVNNAFSICEKHIKSQMEQLEQQVNLHA